MVTAEKKHPVGSVLQSTKYYSSVSGCSLWFLMKPPNLELCRRQNFEWIYTFLKLPLLERSSPLTCCFQLCFICLPHLFQQTIHCFPFSKAQLWHSYEQQEFLFLTNEKIKDPERHRLSFQRLSTDMTASSWNPKELNASVSLDSACPPSAENRYVRRLSLMTGRPIRLGVQAPALQRQRSCEPDHPVSHNLLNTIEE